MLAAGAEIEVLYVHGHWRGVNDLEDFRHAAEWLAEQDSLISTPPKAARALPLPLTQQDQSILIFITGVLLPGLIVFGGVMVWWRRRVFS